MDDVGEARMEDRLMEEDVKTADRAEGAVAAGESDHLLGLEMSPGMRLNVILIARTGLETAVVGQAL